MLKSLQMDKPPSHRFQMWDLSKDGSKDARNSAGRYERPARSELLHHDLGGHRTVSDAVTLNSLYDHRLPIDVELPARCMMPSGRSTTCKTRKISSESVDLVYDLQTAGYPIRYPEEIPIGSTIHLDVDRIGNFHGAVTSQNTEGFQLSVDMACKGMLITKLTQVAAAIRRTTFEEPPATARKNVTRIEPLIKNCSYTDDMGQARKGKIINISVYDALIKAAVVPPVGAHIVFAGRHSRIAEVMRTFEIGFAVQFATPIPDVEFSPAIKFLDE
jgi:hypothetical protein